MTDAYVEDLAEMVPCLVCGEPGPAGEPCPCMAPTGFYTLIVEVQGKTPKDLPGRQELADAIFEGLPKEWGDIEVDDWRLVSIYADGAPEVYNCPEEA